ncbi:MAG: TIGR00730 family Rossman fold protein [Muribaculaceae bacterium]|nr:TIGR00730 family Rossman fold protein [Muribaculaceae bacterium]
MVKTITVYCASSSNIDEAYFNAARELGRLMAQCGVTLVTGSGKMGLMGAVNDGAIEQGGHTIGVIPRFMFERQWQHPGLSELIVTDDMHRRKETMASLADAVIALPGGVGTFEELLEIITWRKLGLFDGQIIILNTLGYYNPLLQMLHDSASKGFMRNLDLGLWKVAETPQQAIEMLV